MLKKLTECWECWSLTVPFWGVGFISEVPAVQTSPGCLLYCCQGKSEIKDENVSLESAIKYLRITGTWKLNCVYILYVAGLPSGCHGDRLVSTNLWLVAWHLLSGKSQLILLIQNQSENIIFDGSVAANGCALFIVGDVRCDSEGQGAEFWLCPRYHHVPPLAGRHGLRLLLCLLYSSAKRGTLEDWSETQSHPDLYKTSQATFSF